APIPLLIDEHLASLLADDGPFSLWTELSPDSKVAAYVKLLVQMDLARQDRKWVEAAAQSAAIMSAEREAELLAEQRVALADLSAKHMADAWVAGFLEMVGAEAGGDVVGTGEAAAGLAVPVVEVAATEPVDESEVPEDNDNADDEDKTPNANRQAEESVPGLKGKKTVSLTARRDFKLQKGSCNKCWADNDPEGCWYHTGTQPCYRCDALKRACTFSGRKSCERGKVDPHMQRNFEKAVLVRHARAFVVTQWELATAGGTTSLNVASLALPTSQESGIAVDVAASEPATPKGKAKAVSSPCKWLASLSSDSRPAKQSRSGTASQKGAKVVPCQEETPPVAGPSLQIIPVNPIKPVLCPGGVVLSNPELPSGVKVQSDHEEAAESSDSSESSSEVLVVLRRAVSQVLSLTALHLMTEGIGLSDFCPCPAEYIEAAKEKAEGMTVVLRKDMRAAALEMEGLRLRKRIMEHSVDILERYQADCTEALEWRQANEAHLQEPFATLFPLLPGASLDP
ncbi:hypothetical protein C0992_006823, partial [Termitomyces sp. T32_za158]